MTRDRKLLLVGGLVTLLAAILGLNLVALKVAVRYAGPITVQGMSAVAASAAMFALAGASGGRLVLPRRYLGPAMAVSLALTVGSSMGVVLGVQRVSAGTAALLMSTMPIITLVLGWLLLRERHGWQGALGVLVGFLGVGLVASAARNEGATEVLGVVFMLLGAASWALGLVLMKLLADGAARSTFVAWQMLLGAPILLAAALALEGGAVRWSWTYVGAVLYAGVVSKGLSFFLQLTVVRLGSAVHASTVAFLLPVFGTMAGVALLAERVTPAQIQGAVAILAGVALVLRSRPPTEPVPP